MAESTVKRLIVQLGADISDFQKQFELATKTLEKQADKIQKIGEQMTKYVTLPILAAGTAFITMAAQEEQAFKRVGTSLQLAGVQWSKAEQPVLSYLAALQAASRFDETELAGALTQMTTISGDAQAAINGLSTAMDMAASGLMDLDTASKLIGKAMAGNTEAFKRYGIEIAAGSSATEVLTQLQAKFAGHSTGALDTVIGRFMQLKNRIFDAAEDMGHHLEPFTMKAMDAIGLLANMAKAAADWFGKLSPNAKAVTISFVMIAAAAGPLMLVIAGMIKGWVALKAMLAFVGTGTMVVVAKILLLAAAVTFVIANWEKLKAMGAAIWNGLVFLVLTAVSKILEGLAFLDSLVPKIFGGLAQKQSELAKSTSELADSYGLKFSEAAVTMESSGSWIGNTVDFMGSKINEAMGKLAGLGQAVVNVGTKPPLVMPQLSAMAQFFSTWAAQMKKTAADLANSVSDSMASMAASMVSSLATGTFDAKKMLLDFAVQSLEMIVKWAIQGMFAAMGLSQALTAAFANPLIAVGVIAGLIALVAGLSASYKSSVALAGGGLTSGPVNALIGDNPSGEEAVLPLDNPRAGRKIAEFMGGGSGGAATIIVELDGRVIAQSTVDHLPGVLRLQGIGT